MTIKFMFIVVHLPIKLPTTPNVRVRLPALHYYAHYLHTEIYLRRALAEVVCKGELQSPHRIGSSVVALRTLRILDRTCVCTCTYVQR